MSLCVFAQSTKLDSLHHKAREYNLKGSYAELFLTYNALKNEYVNLRDTNEIVSTILSMADASRGGGSYTEALKILDNLDILVTSNKYLYYNYLNFNNYSYYNIYC